MSCDVLEKTDLDTGTYHMDFTNKLPSGRVLADDAPTITWLYADGSSVAAADRPATATYVLEPENSMSWQFDITGGTLGKIYMIRVVAKDDDMKVIEGNGILRIRIPCLA